MTYVDGFVIPVPTKRLAAYKKMAQFGAKMWMEHGAVAYHETAGDDLQSKWGTTFSKALKLKKGETAVFAWIVFKSRAHRDKVNAKVMSDPRMQEGPKEMPFDIKRMVYGGFTTLVSR
jgi:uncharacterized protein YbaA (DUF1428 family)